jgi:flagellar biosynthesis/type III secretory pathway chaperone
MNMMPRQPPRPNVPPQDRSMTPPRSALRAAVAQPAHRDAPRQVAPSANTHRVDDIMGVVRQLSDLLTKENLALKRHQTNEVKTLGERKEQLARLYQQHMNAIHRDPAAVKTWEPNKRTALSAAAKRLSELMNENASLLKANITAVNKFLKTVVEAVKEKHEKTSASYSKQGALSGYTSVKRNLAVSYNQTL